MGGEPEVISSDSAAILPSEELPWRTGHLHVALACLLANLHATQHKSGLCACIQERDTCDPDNGLGAPIWPGLPASWISCVLCSCPHCSYPPWRMWLEKRSRETHRGPKLPFPHMLWAMREEGGERCASGRGLSSLKHPTRGRPFRWWWAVG